jgi:hypothetical protein
MKPGDRVKLRAQALYSMCVLAGPLTEQVWTVLECHCDLCQLAGHVLVEPDRHFARSALRPAEGPCIDELRAGDADALSFGVRAGVVRAIRYGGRWPSGDKVR